MSKINKLSTVDIEDGQAFQFANFAKSAAKKKGKGKSMAKGKMPPDKDAEGSKAKEPKLDGSAPKKGMK